MKRHLRAEELLVKIEKGFVDLKDVVDFSVYVIGNDRVKIIAAGQGKAGLFQKLVRLRPAELQCDRKGDGRAK